MNALKQSAPGKIFQFEIELCEPIAAGFQHRAGAVCADDQITDNLGQRGIISSLTGIFLFGNIHQTQACKAKP